MSPRSKRVTISDVAAAAGVDPAVVSRLMNDNPNLSIRETTRQRVLDAINELGYRPNSAARSLRTARAHAWGLLIPSFNNPVYSEIIAGAEDEAARRESVLLVGSLDDPAQGQRFFDRLGHGRVDGLMYMGSGSVPNSVRELEIRTIEVNRQSLGSRRYVILDDERGAAMATDYLLELGHELIGHIGGPAEADTARRRLEGFQTTLHEAGIEPGPYLGADYTPNGGYEAMSVMLDDDPPTAIFCANVASAIGALAAARDRMMNVPADVSVIAVHDHALAEYLTPPLTTVRMPLRELGERALRLLADKGETDVIEEIVRSPMELAIRESTDVPR